MPNRCPVISSHLFLDVPAHRQDDPTQQLKQQHELTLEQIRMLLEASMERQMGSLEELLLRYVRRDRDAGIGGKELNGGPNHTAFHM